MESYRPSGRGQVPESSAVFRTPPAFRPPPSVRLGLFVRPNHRLVFASFPDRDETCSKTLIRRAGWEEVLVDRKSPSTMLLPSSMYISRSRGPYRYAPLLNAHVLHTSYVREVAANYPDSHTLPTTRSLHRIVSIDEWQLKHPLGKGHAACLFDCACGRHRAHI